MIPIKNSIGIRRIFEARDTVGLSSTQVLLKPDESQDNKYIKYLNDDNILNILILLDSDVFSILNNYLNNINITERNYYIKSLDNIKYDIFQDYELYQFLINCINFANNIINKNNDSDDLLLYSNIWKVFIYDNMMWNLPFTLEDIIFIPISYIKSSYNNNSYQNFTKTMFHERIHISQRLNINKWNNYIQNNNVNY